MEYKNYFETRNGNYYLYLPSEYTFHLLPESCMPYWTGEKEPDDSYESRKVAFFQQLLKREAKEEFITEYSPIKLKKNLANLNHLLIEVTDGCNLACKYCGYGDLYGNYDKRENKNNTFQNSLSAGTNFLFYMKWNTKSNMSFIENQIIIDTSVSDNVKLFDYSGTLSMKKIFLSNNCIYPSESNIIKSANLKSFQKGFPSICQVDEPETPTPITPTTQITPTPLTPTQIPTIEPTEIITSKPSEIIVCPTKPSPNLLEIQDNQGLSNGKNKSIYLI